MRILNSTTLHGWSAGSWYALGMLKGLRERGHEIHVLVPEGRTAEHARRAGIEVITEPDLRSVGARSFLRTARALRELRDQRIRPDLIITHWGPDHAWWGALAGRSGRRIPLLRMRAHDPRPPARHPFARWLQQGRTDGFIVANERQRRSYVERAGVEPRRVHRIPPGFPLSEWEGGPDGSAVRARCNVGEEMLLIASIARFAPQKDHETFFEAAARVALQAPDVHFLVAGYEAERSTEDIERLAARYPALQGRWTLWSERLEDGRSLVRAADIGVVHSSRSEAICRVALEYMAESIPIIGTKVGALPEVIGEWESGLLVAPGDAGALAGALMRMIRSPALLQRLGAGGRRRLVARFGAERAVETLERVLERYVESVRPRPYV